MKTKTKLLGFGAIAALVASIMSAPVANANQMPTPDLVYKTCYLTLPSTWVITGQATWSDDRIEYANIGSYLSGDCPSTTELAPGQTPDVNVNSYNYESGGVKIGYNAFTWSGMNFPGLQAPWDDTESMRLYAEDNGVDANGLQLRTLKWVNYAPTTWWAAMGSVWTPRGAEFYDNVWTGNVTTEDCQYSAVDCPGGYKVDNYKLVTVNSLTYKFASPFSATAKKKGSSLTFKVNQNRSATMSVFDQTESEVRAFSGDKVQVFRNGKLIKSKGFTKMGNSKITVTDKRGKQTYMVCIAETVRSWSECKTFIK